MPTFIIREKFFAYSDEVFYVTGHRIVQIFKNQNEAELMYKQFEIESARNFELNEISSFFDASLEELQKYDDFVFSRCKEHIIEDGRVIESILPETLNDEDTFTFVQMAKMQSYQIIKFDDTAEFYGLWSIKAQDWYKEYHEGFEGLIYVENEAELQEKMEHVFYEGGDAHIILKGTLEELTEYPILLANFIATQPGLEYKNQTLTIKKWDNEALFCANPLLKKPFFEIRKLSLNDVLMIEQQLKDLYYYDVE